jgi:hypothetical protein
MPADFNGTVALSYDATDEKGEPPAGLIFYDVKPTRERPDAATDNLGTRAGHPLAVTDLLRNDFDRDHDPCILRWPPGNGSLSSSLPMSRSRRRRRSSRCGLSEASDGPLPSGHDRHRPGARGRRRSPSQPTSISASRGRWGHIQSATLTQPSTATPAPLPSIPQRAFSGDDGFTYVATDDHEGRRPARPLHVRPSTIRPPLRIRSRFHRGHAVLIDPQTLLANDFDDGNPIRLSTSPTPPTARSARRHTYPVHARPPKAPRSFEYIVTDDTNAPASARSRSTSFDQPRAHRRNGCL